MADGAIGRSPQISRGTLWVFWPCGLTAMNDAVRPGRSAAAEVVHLRARNTSQGVRPGRKRAQTLICNTTRPAGGGRGVGLRARSCVFARATQLAPREGRQAGLPAPPWG